MARVVNFLQQNWRAAVEIMILTVGIYYVINFIRGTRGASVVMGFVGLLVTLSFLTVWLDLTVLGALLGAAAVYLSVAVIVLFQPEIRRMLAQLGDLPLFATAQEERENIEVIVQTVERLSEVRIGLLLAVERSVNVQQAVESGIEVDCVATPEMLETIFFPNNALHDGGVIMRGDRIAYAACIYPVVATGESLAHPRHAPPRGHRAFRRNGCGGGGGFGGDRLGIVRVSGTAGARD